MCIFKVKSSHIYALCTPIASILRRANRDALGVHRAIYMSTGSKPARRVESLAGFSYIIYFIDTM